MAADPHSPSTNAKWLTLCGERRIRLKEDAGAAGVGVGVEGGIDNKNH
jgi:hypothetical protein